MSESNADSSGRNNQQNKKTPEEVATTLREVAYTNEEVEATAEEEAESMEEVEVSPTPSTTTERKVS